MFKATMKDLKMGKNGITINLTDCVLSDEQLVSLRQLINNQVIVVIDEAIEQMQMDFTIGEGIDPEDVE